MTFTHFAQWKVLWPRFEALPPLIIRHSHQCLSVIGSRGSPAEEIGWSRKLAWISCDTDSIEPADQLLIKVASHRQQPATHLFKGLSRKCEAGVKAAGGVFFWYLA
jgi:hypothetical protein